VYSSLEDCQQAAEMAGKPYVVYSSNRHCVIDDDCRNPITGTVWAFVVYYNTNLVTITTTTTLTPSPWERVPELADNTKCSTGSSQMYSSLEGCQQAAEMAGMPYVVYAPNGYCVIEDDCDSPITGTDWAFVVYHNTDLVSTLDDELSIVMQATGVTDDNKQDVCDAVADALDGECSYVSLEGPSTRRRRLQESDVFMDISVEDSESAAATVEGADFLDSVIMPQGTSAISLTTGDGSKYALGSLGASCEEGAYILTLEECRQAVAELSIESEGEWSGSHDPLVPGCSIKPSEGNTIHFNTNMDAQPRSLEQPICLKETVTSTTTTSKATTTPTPVTVLKLEYTSEGFCSRRLEIDSASSAEACAVLAQSGPSSAYCHQDNLIISYGKGSRAGRCMCGTSANCDYTALTWGNDGFTSYRVTTEELSEQVSMEMQVVGVTEENKQGICDATAQALDGSCSYVSLQSPAGNRRRLQTTVYMDVAVADAQAAAAIVEDDAFISSVQNSDSMPEGTTPMGVTATQIATTTTITTSDFENTPSFLLKLHTSMSDFL